MTQVLLNLTVNAIRYTPEGGSVTISVQERPSDDANEAALTVEIADTGVGIAPEQLEHIFNRFYRTGRMKPARAKAAVWGLTLRSPRN